jgi:hypothetical protein
MLADEDSRFRMIEFNGMKRPLAQWARALGVSPKSLERRLASLPIAKAMTPGRLTPTPRKMQLRVKER